MAKKDIPVYLFVGFLESGKTRFVQETLEDPRFGCDEKTLVLLCEEGEEEYKPEKFAFGGVEMRSIEDKSELTVENLDRLVEETGAGRVLIEYNGMWLDDDLTTNIPENWTIYQTICTVDSTTFRPYFDNMRQLMLDKFAVSELVVFNRADAVNNQADQEYIHKCVRQASRRADIAYEFKDGAVAYDEIPDELPFDINADIIDIKDEDYGIWFMDASEYPDKYDGKTIRFTAQVCHTDQVSKGQFVPGRFAMTCCIQDIQFVGFPCKYKDEKKLEQRSWIKITAKVRIQYHPIFEGEGEGRGPVLTAISVEPAQALEQDYVTFS